ncbi:hypothetical protein D3C72_1464900 [compost metagenome]
MNLAHPFAGTMLAQAAIGLRDPRRRRGLGGDRGQLLAGFEPRHRDQTGDFHEAERHAPQVNVHAARGIGKMKGLADPIRRANGDLEARVTIDVETEGPGV